MCPRDIVGYMYFKVAPATAPAHSGGENWQTAEIGQANGQNRLCYSMDSPSITISNSMHFTKALGAILMITKRNLIQEMFRCKIEKGER